MLRVLVCILSMLAFSACNSKSVPPLKSPCVSASPALTGNPAQADNPCVKRSVNAHWLG